MSQSCTAIMLRSLLIVLIDLYKRWLSPLLGPRCRFHPSCSSYARQALLQHGLLRGGWMAGIRLLRCSPLSQGGLDPVPSRFHWWPTATRGKHSCAHDHHSKDLQ